jgi:hypothetical protein
MENQEVRIVPIRIKDLYSVVAELIDQAAPGTYIPLTKHRAKAIAANPNARPDDVSYFFAYLGEELVGYFGSINVCLQAKGEFYNIYWLTTWNANPKMRGKGVGKKDYLLSGNAPTRYVCEKLGWIPIHSLEIAILDFGLVGRYNPILLTARALRKIANLSGGRLNITNLQKSSSRFFETMFGGLVRSGVRRRAMKDVGALPSGLKMEAVQQVRMEAHPPNLDVNITRLYRGPQVVNWMLKYPWVVPPGESDSEHLDYFFSDTRPDFEITAHEVTMDGEYQGYLVFQLATLEKRRVMRILDVELQDERWVLPLAMSMAEQEGVGKIEMNTSFAKDVRDKAYYFTRKRIYHYFPHPNRPDSPLAKAYKSLVCSYADGDMGFT